MSCKKPDVARRLRRVKTETDMKKMGIKENCDGKKKKKKRKEPEEGEKKGMRKCEEKDKKGAHI